MLFLITALISELLLHCKPGLDQVGNSKKKGGNAR